MLPSLILLAIALVDGRRFSAIARHASVLIATSVYVALRTIDTFVLIGEYSSAKSLDFGGDPVDNAKLYLAFLTNRMYLTTVPHLLLLIALAAMLFAISRYRTGVQRSNHRFGSWFGRCYLS